MHNNIMAAGSKDRPPMLGPGRYSQWRSRFLRYIDTKPNGEGLRKSILSGPYVPSTVLVQAVAATEGNPAIQQHTTIETVLNMTPENKEHFLSEKEAIFLLLTGIGDDIYSTVDACKTANEMWIAIERLQQGESLNVQDVKTNLFWEFGKFTSRDGESMESYYSRFYKLMNELTRNNLQVTTMQVNVQFLQQLQPEWSRFVTVVKQSKEIDTISYHTLFDILKQYQNEVNDIRAERIAKSANPLVLLAAAQPYSYNYYQVPKPQRFNATSSSTRPSASTRHKGKEIAKPVTPQSESVSEEDNDPEQAQRDNDMQKNLALLAKNKTEDTTPRYNNNNQSGQFGNQRTMTVAGTRETVGSPVVQQTGIQCFNCKGFGHYAKECRKPKRVKDYTYHKEKMMMCKQAEQGVSLQAKQADWLADTDEEINEQELEAHYSFMGKIQEVLPEESSSTEQPLEQARTSRFEAWNEENIRNARLWKLCTLPTIFCSKGGLEDKILVPKTPDSSQRPPQDYDQDLLNTYQSSDDDTNVVNAPQEPFVVKQDPGKNSSQSPPQIDHNCCYECGDSLDGIFCQRCTCKSCGKGAHIGYNCLPKAPIISNPEPCNNQTDDELPQTLPSFDPTCYSGDGSSFTYDSTPNFVNDSLNPPPQPPTYTYEFCGNDAYYGHDCPPQIPVCYDDDDDDESSIPLKDIIISGLPPCVAITPVLSTEEPVDSLIMEDEHLDTIPATESDEFIIESTRFLATLPPVIDYFTSISSENDDKVFNHGVLASKEKSPPFLSHRGLKASKLFHQKSPMLIHGDNTPNLGVRHLHFYPP
ncbi:retrovirus-related pol polyprotein from transposon TNT 1-94 [Tanacetum coccineum]